MRVLLGLAALAASSSSVQAITQVALSGAATNVGAQVPGVGKVALATINIFQTALNGPPPTLNGGISPSGFIQTGAYVNSNNFSMTVAKDITTIVFQFTTNEFTAQIQHRWGPDYTSPAVLFPTTPGLTQQSYTCDTCAGGTAITCNTGVGPGATPSPSSGWLCSNLTRVYTMTGLTQSTLTQQIANSLSVQLFDRNTNPAPNVSSYSFTVVRQPAQIAGDPQISGLQGQDFQVHGMPDEIFNMITYPNLQVNARFVYLSAGECHDNFTACFAHPGTYIAEEGIRLGNDKIHVKAGSFKKGLTVSVNGKRVSDKKTHVKLGSVELVNHRRVVIKTPIMSLEISNSDKFLNQASTLADSKLLALGSVRRVLADGESFHSEVPLHGLQGQTWRNVEYPSGLEYEGSISDYHVTDGNLFGTAFTFNQFKQ